jgi:hypothetical protein
MALVIFEIEHYRVIAIQSGPFRERDFSFLKAPTFPKPSQRHEPDLHVLS